MLNVNWFQKQPNGNDEVISVFENVVLFNKYMVFCELSCKFLFEICHSFNGFCGIRFFFHLFVGNL